MDRGKEREGKKTETLTWQIDRQTDKQSGRQAAGR